MIERFFPDKEVRKIEQIALGDLKDKGIKALIIDIDNTIAPWNEEPSDEKVLWLKTMQCNGMKVCLISNNSRQRVEGLSINLGIHGIHGALKPRRKAYISAISLLGVKAKETAVIGDQLFTDVYGGNRLNMYTIYVNPISEKDYFFVNIKRYFERYVLKKYHAQDFDQKEDRYIWKSKSGERKLRKYEGRNN